MRFDVIIPIRLSVIVCDFLTCFYFSSCKYKNSSFFNPHLRQRPLKWLSTLRIPEQAGHFCIFLHLTQKRKLSLSLLFNTINIFLFSDVSLKFSQRSRSRVRRVDFDTPHTLLAPGMILCHPSQGIRVCLCLDLEICVRYYFV